MQITTDEALSADDILKAHANGGLKAAPSQPIVAKRPSEPVKPANSNPLVAKPYEEKPDAPKITVDEAWIDRNYRIFNDKYFGGKLPYPIAFETNNSNRRWGFASYKRIIDTSTRKYVQKLTGFKISISNFNKTSEHTKLGTLLHEMVHIADYVFHPEHFVDSRGEVVSRRRYDAHGPAFFLMEAARLKADGWNITRYVTSEELSDAEVSDANRARVDSRVRNALVGVLVYGDYNFMFKTDKQSIDDVVSRIERYRDWYVSKGLKRIDFYETSSERFAIMRSCKTKMMGWEIRSEEELRQKFAELKVGKLYKSVEILGTRR